MREVAVREDVKGVVVQGMAILLKGRAAEVMGVMDRILLRMAVRS